MGEKRFKWIIFPGHNPSERVGEKRFKWVILPGHDLSEREVRAGIQPEAMEQGYLLASSLLVLTQLSYIAQPYLPGDRATLQDAGPSTSIISQDHLIKSCTGPSDQRNPPTPPSDDSRLCQVDSWG